MSLDNFLTDEQKLGDNYEKFLKLKAQFEKEGIPENIATYKASAVLTPNTLEKIKLAVKNEEGLRYGVTFFFDDEEDLKLLGKYFYYNPHIKQVKDGKLLIELLKLMEK